MPGLGRKDKEKLRQALESIPADLAELRPAILDIAKQDQDLLGSGEADDRVFIRAVKKLVGPDGVVDGRAIAERLKKWANELGARDEIWGGPIWFATGYLAMLGKRRPDELIEQVRPAANGLERTTFEIPQGMKVKSWAKGMELSNREVTIVVCETDPEFLEIDRKKYVRMAGGETGSQPPETTWEFDFAFQTGGARGIRATLRDTETTLTIFCEYAVTVGPACLKVSFFAKGKRSRPLEKYEGFLAKIRAR